LTFSAGLGHFIAITATDLSQKTGAVQKLDQTRTRRTADLRNTIQNLGVLVSRQEAAQQF
jgi:hypothetical protein